MKLIKEARDGDIQIRAGIVITSRAYVLVEQPANMIRNGWKLDLPKGHIQQGESPLQAAIREVYEETNIKFAPWKLTRPIQTTCDGDPLFLFLAEIDELIPVNLLSCISVFVDENGIRKPEVEAYYWLNPYTQLHLMQDRLIHGIKYYFHNQRCSESENEISEMEREFEDLQIAGGMAGSVPPHISSIISLGYKNGGVLSPPDVKAKNDYSAIASF